MSQAAGHGLWTLRAAVEKHGEPPPRSLASPAHRPCSVPAGVAVAVGPGSTPCPEAPMSPARSLSRRLAAVVALTASVLVVLVAPASAATPPPLTPRQEAVVLDLIDDICGDTWCEGDYAFDFRSFSCEPAERTCTLRLRIARYDDGPLQWRWRTGTVHGFVRFSQMVETSSSGYQSLDWDFYEAVSALISRVEARTPVAG